MTMRAGVVAAWLTAGLLLVATGPAAATTDVITSHDGSEVYMAGGSLTTFSRGAGGALTSGELPEPGGDFLAISPDGTVLYEAAAYDSGYANGIRIFTRDPHSGRLTYERTYLGDGARTFDLITAMQLSPDGRFLYIGQGGHWTPYNGQPKGDPAIHVLRTGADGEDLSFVQSLWEEDHGLTEIDDLLLAPGGAQLYASGGVILRLARDAATGTLTPLAGLTPSERYGRLTLSPAGDRMYIGSPYGNPEYYGIFSRDTASGHLTSMGNSGDHCAPAACPTGEVLGVSPDGKTVFSAPREYPHSKLLVQAGVTADGVAPGRSYGRALLTEVEQPYALTWSPDGRFAYLAGWASPGTERSSLTVLRWDDDTRTLTQLSALKENGYLDAHDFPTISIDDGELYTNDPNVTVTFKPPTGVTSFRFANDPSELDEGRAVRVSDAGVYRWRLDTSGPPERVVRKVYARVTPTWNFDQPPLQVFDDIVLDQRPPELQSARLEVAGESSTLVVRARDKASGVHGLQVAQDVHHPGRVRKFARRVTLSGAPKSVHVRVIDGAGNRGRWRVAKRG